jgi:hypothetical protein
MKILLKLLKGIIGIVTLIIFSLIMVFKCEENRSVDDVFKCVDERLGIERNDYRIHGRAARLFVLQDPSALQKIKLNKSGREKIEAYILHYQDTLESIYIPESIRRYYKPVFDRANTRLSNNLPDNLDLDIISEILEDSDEAYIRMQTSQVDRYFEQFCWLGGDYWKMIVDRKRGIIYREYGSI